MPGDEETMTDEAIWETLPVCSAIMFSIKELFHNSFDTIHLDVCLSTWRCKNLSCWYLIEI